MAFLGICPSCTVFLRETLEDLQRPELARHIQELRSELDRSKDMRREMWDAVKAQDTAVHEALESRHGAEALKLALQNQNLLASRLHEGLDIVSQKAELAAFMPRYEELVEMAAFAKPAWGELLESPPASYALAAMATLHEALERAPFTEEGTAALHSQLGDWSGIRLTDELFDQQKRQEMYFRAGLDQRLIDLEPQAFDAMLSATELRPSNPPPLLRAYVSADLEEKVEVEEDEEIDQAGEDYRALYRFESQLRGFVADVLSKAAGPDWYKQRVPGDCLSEWKKRRANDREAKKHVHPWPSYADLGDWSKTILRKDNWPLFKPFFNRQTFVEESFNRLIPLRNDVAHIRPLTKPDRLVFYAEIQQLSVAIRRPQADEEDDAFEEAALSE